MAPTPLTAPYRLVMKYTVNTFLHKQQNYVDVVPSGDPSGYDLLDQRGGSPIGLQTGVDAFFTKIAPFYNPAWSSFDGWLLEARVGTAFVFLAAGITTVVPTSAGNFEIANGLVITGKDDDNRIMPAMLYEGTFGGAVRVTAAAGLTVASRALMNYFFNPDGTAAATAAWFWRGSRSMVPAQRWIAWVVDTNEKLRRARRIK